MNEPLDTPSMNDLLRRPPETPRERNRRIEERLRQPHEPDTDPAHHEEREDTE